MRAASVWAALRQVLGGLRYLPPSVSRDVVDRELAGTRTHPFRRLTKREREVFEPDPFPADALTRSCNVTRRAPIGTSQFRDIPHRRHVVSHLACYHRPELADVFNMIIRRAEVKPGFTINGAPK